MLIVALLRPLAETAWRRWTVAATVGLAASLAFVSTPAGAASVDAALLESVRVLALEKSAEGQVAPGAGSAIAAGPAATTPSPRLEVVVGALDPRLRLAPCDRIEPYLPPGVRLWGRSRIGLRCKEGQTLWNVYLPITVKAWGRAWVVPAGAAAGATLVPADLAEAEVDLADEPSPVVADPSLAAGRMLAQALRPGQAVRQSHLKLRQWFAAGETVKIVAVGPGFSLESEGQALGHGIEGSPARVRIDGGRILTGAPVGERRVEVGL